MADVSNNEDIIDSRDVIARIEELEGSVEAATDEKEEPDEDEVEELKILKALADEAECSPDWNYGETLIRDSYFEDYARQLAEDIGAIGKDTQWPATCIDWEQAAEQLKEDYMEVDFDGETYWIRA
jgi:hypothetical protein